MRVLLTGGAGFAGAHFAEHLLRNTDCELVLLDRLDTSGNLNRITQIQNWDKFRTRCRWVFHDLRAPISSPIMARIGPITHVVHMAAGTHVDRSVSDPMSFVYDNVVATGNILEYCRAIIHELERVVYFSTDEVFGPALEGVHFKEWDRYKSGNPYSATKAGGEELCLAYHNTYRLPIFVTHTMNLIGERQHPEKFVPMTIAKVLRDDLVTIHADATRTTPGSRFYIHARNAAAALLFLLDRAENGDKYNIVGELEVNNLALATMIAEIVDRPLRYEMVDYHSSRPGHDLRYALDGSKMRNMGWQPPRKFYESLVSTVEWTLRNREWLVS